MADKRAYDAAKRYWQSVIDEQIDVAKEIIEDGSYKENPERAKIFSQTALAVEYMEKVPAFIDKLKNDEKK